jgi:aminoglycoside 6'-N-acetyltransferase
MIRFRDVVKQDMPMLYDWANLAFVSKWYDRRKLMYDDIERKFTAGVIQIPRLHSYIIMDDNHPFGYIQTYRVRDYPSYARCVQMGDDVAGLDMYFGDLSYVGKGYASQILPLFLERHVFTLAGITTCIVGPEPDNRPAIRAYEKAGFQYMKTMQCNGQEKPEYIMAIMERREYTLFQQGQETSTEGHD